jgi:small lipoprotein (TIGR04454 family)
MARLAPCLSVLLFLSGCGRPATLQECEEIAGRVATLEYEAASKSNVAPEAEKIQTIRARVHDAMLKGCVGKRITERALSCVRNAKTANVIQKDCFD